MALEKRDQKASSRESPPSNNISVEELDRRIERINEELRRTVGPTTQAPAYQESTVNYKLYLLIFLLIGAGIFGLVKFGNQFVGMTTYSGNLEKEVHISTSENNEYQIVLNGTPNSVRISGTVEGSGTAQVYLILNNSRKLVGSFDNIPDKSPITGMVTGINGEEITSENETVVPAVNETVVPAETANTTTDLNTTISEPTNATVVLPYNQTNEQALNTTIAVNTTIVLPLNQTQQTREEEPAANQTIPIEPIVAISPAKLFDSVCVESCKISGASPSITLLVEVTNATINITKIGYTVEQVTQPKGKIYWNSNITSFNVPGSLELNLSRYFVSEDNKQLTYLAGSADNLSITVNGDTLKIIPIANVSGTRELTLFASDLNYTASQDITLLFLSVNISNSSISMPETNSTINNSFLIQGRAIIGQAVKWTKIVAVVNGTAEVDIPSYAGNITINPENGIAVPLCEPKTLTGQRAILSSRCEERQKAKLSSVPGLSGISSISNTNDTPKANETINPMNQTVVLIRTNTTEQYVINSSQDQVEVSYETPGPVATETNISSLTKRIVVHSLVNYTNITAFSEIQPSKPADIHLYWYVNADDNTRYFGTSASETQKIDVSQNVLTSMRLVDTNNDSLIERVEWQVPHLSNQTFEISISIINVQSYPIVGGNWTVAFTTGGVANLTISASNGTTWGNEAPSDLQRLVLRCGNQIVDAEFNGTRVFVANWNCSGTGYHTVKVLSAGVHHQKFIYGNQVAYAHNDAAPTLTLVSPTPANRTDLISNSSATINISIREANLTKFRWIWNGMNTTLYENSLVLMMNFENLTSLGENQTFVSDLSSSKNNGRVFGSTMGITSSGKYGKGLLVSGKGSTLNVTLSRSLNLTKNWTIMAWVNIANKWGYSENIMARGKGGGYQYAMLRAANGVIQCNFANAGGTGQSTPSTFVPANISVNQWHHLACEWDGTILSLYVDGKLLYQAYPTGTPIVTNNDNLVIGGNTSNRGVFNGSLDEVRIFNRSLTANEVKQMYFSNLLKGAPDKWQFLATESDLDSYGHAIMNYSGYTLNSYNLPNTTGTRILYVNNVPRPAFRSPTPPDNARTQNKTVRMNVSINEKNLSTFKWNWEGTNYTQYDPSLVLMMNFDNNNYNYLKAVSNMSWVSGNSVVYEDLTSVTDYTIQSGDYLEYDVYWTTSGDFIAMDYTTSLGNYLRGFANDQNGLASHPATDISRFALNKWYHRIILLPVSHVGQIIQYYDVVCRANDRLQHTGYLRNVVITDGAGTVRKVIFQGNGVTHAQHTSANGIMLSLDSMEGDASIYRNNGKVNETTNWTSSGKYGGSYRFNGVNSYIEVPDSQSLRLNDNFTISLWIKRLSNGGWERLLGKTNASAPTAIDGDYWLQISNLDTVNFRVTKALDNTSMIASGQTNLSLNTWYHITATKSKSTMTVYVNGIQDGTSSNDSYPSTLRTYNFPLEIGRFGQNNWFYAFNGTIDELRIYNRTLSAGEVYQLYRSNLRKFSTNSWEFYSNQTIVPDVYTYGAYVTNVFGISNYTGIRNLNQNNTRPKIRYESKTTADKTLIQTGQRLVMNVTTIDSNLTIFKSVINGANVTFLDEDTMLMLGFNNLSALGENQNKANDTSGHGNNGKIFGAKFTANGRYGGALIFNGSAKINTTDSNSLDPKIISVEAWIKPSNSQYANRMQNIVSKWGHSNTSEFQNTNYWDVYDAKNTSGMSTIGYVGAGFDGRYIYFIPYNNATIHGRVLRYDTANNFSAKTSWSAKDIKSIDGTLSDIGYYGSVFDGRYLYLIPYNNGTRHAKVARYDTTQQFNLSSSWQVYNAKNTDGVQGTVGFIGGAYDGKYVYFSPYDNGTQFHGKFLSYNTSGDFTSASSWSYIDVKNKDGGSKTVGYSGGVFDGKYIYYAPYNGGNGSEVLRFNTSGRFTDLNAWDYYDIKNLNGANGLHGYYPGVFDGKYVYFAPFYNRSKYHAKMVRYNTSGSFKAASSWQYFDAQNENGANSLGGFMNAAFDGRYIYFSPRQNTSQFHSQVLRFDTTLSFTDTNSWDVYDAKNEDGKNNAIGYTGVMFDGRYLYFSPLRNSTIFHARVLRYDTAGKNASSYSLDYGTSSDTFGTGASFPTFRVNTYLGIRTIGATSVSSLKGGWHYLAGTYNGTQSRIYVDAVLQRSINYSSYLPIKSSTSGVTIASDSGGRPYFNGTIDEVRIYNRSLTAVEVLQHYYSNLKKYLSNTWEFYSNQSVNSYTSFKACATNGFEGSNCTAQRELIVSYLNASVYNPINNTVVARYRLFTVNSTIKCLGLVNASCGKVYAIARYNKSNSEANTQIGKKTAPVRFKDAAYLNWNISDLPWGLMGNAVALDSHDNVALAAADISGYVRTMRYNSTGSWLWNYSWHTAQGAVYGVAIDSSDNIITTGYDTSGYHYRTFKYSKTGTLIWNKEYSAGYVSNGDAVDSQDNIDIAGYNGVYDWVIMQYNTSGDVKWANTFADGSYAYGVATDTQDNVIAVGNGIWGTGNLMVKYDRTGGYVWNRTDIPITIAVTTDSQNNIYTVGSSFEIVKYNSLGTKIWNTTAKTGYTSYAITLDSQNNVLVGGQNPVGRATIWKYNSTGGFVMNASYALMARANGIAVDSQDNVVITGLIYGSARAETAKFYIGSNPKYCGAMTVGGGACKAIFSVNATSTLGTKIFLDVLSNSTNKTRGVASANSTDRLVCVGSCVQRLNTTLISPVNGSMQQSPLVLKCITNGTNYLKNISLYTNISGAWSLNDTKQLTKNYTTYYAANWTKTAPLGSYEWNCLSHNEPGTRAWATRNWTFTMLSPPTTGLVSPLSGSKVNKSVILKCNASSQTYLKNISLYTNFSGTWKLNQTRNLINNKTTYYSANFTKIPLIGKYKWNCLVFNNNSLQAWAPSNWTFQSYLFGTLNISFYLPANRTSLNRFNTTVLNSTIKCLGVTNATCPSVFGIARYNQSSSQANTMIGKATAPVAIKARTSVDWNRTDLYGSDPESITVDSQNNVITTSIHWNGSVYLFRTVKYAYNGSTLWNRTYKQGSFPYGVAVDSQDNIFVTGYDPQLYPRTVKYDKFGTLQWNKQFAATGEMHAIAVDSQDRIIAGGRDFTTNFYRIIKYNTNGNTNWSKTYNYSREIFGVGLDSQDNIIVTGQKTAGGGGAVTIKYDRTGGLLWNRTFDGSGSAILAYAVAVDSQDNIIVTGRHPSGNRMLILKYDKNGNLQWNKTTVLGQTGYGIDVDSQDNYIITGSNNAGTKLITVRYNSTGDLTWNSTFMVSSAAAGGAIAVDYQDNMIVAGKTTVGYPLVVKYLYTTNPKRCGTMTAGTSCKAIYTVNATGNVGASVFLDMLSNSSAKNAALPNVNSTDRMIRIAQPYYLNTNLISPDNGLATNRSVVLKCLGNTTIYLKNISLWTNFSGTWKLNATKILTNNRTGVYLANFSKIVPTGSYKWNCLTYENGSRSKWATNWTFITQYLGMLNLSVATPANKTTVARYSLFWMNSTIKCLGGSGATCGKVATAARYNKSSAQANIPIGWNTTPVSMGGMYISWNYTDPVGTMEGKIAVGPNDTFAVVGVNGGSTYTAWYFSNGTRFRNWTNDAGMTSRAVAFDSQGYTIVAKETAGHDYFTVKYNSTGTVWSKTFDKGYQPRGVATDSSNNVIVTGYNQSDYMTVKYNRTGGYMWNRTFTAGAVGYAVAVDSLDNIVMTGAGGGYFRTVKYDKTGTLLWNRTFKDGPTATCLAVDSKNNIVVAGSDASSHILLIKYNSTGSGMWNKSSTLGSIAWGVDFDSLDNILVGGYTAGEDYVLLKYEPGGRFVSSNLYTPGRYLTGAAIDSKDNVIVTGYNVLNKIINVKYGTSSNPKSCGTMNVGSTCQTPFLLNATGVSGTRVFLDVFANSSYKGGTGVVSLNSSDRIICIGTSCCFKGSDCTGGNLCIEGSCRPACNITYVADRCSSGSYSFDSASAGVCTLNMTEQWACLTSRLQENYTVINSFKPDGVNSKTIVNISERDPTLVAYLPFEENYGKTTADWSQYNSDGNISSATVNTTQCWAGNCMRFKGGTDEVKLYNLKVNTAAGQNNTVEFWMNWDGTNMVMPFGWAGDLMLYQSCFGFNTGETNVWGVSSTGMANRWVHVAAIFYNGAATQSALYIDGVRQTLSACTGSTTLSMQAQSPAIISGWIYDKSYKFTGLIDEFRIYNRTLTQGEILRDKDNGKVYREMWKSNSLGGNYQPVGGYFQDFDNMTAGESISRTNDWRVLGTYGSRYNISSDGQLEIFDPGSAPNDAWDATVYYFPGFVPIKLPLVVEYRLNVSDSNSWDLATIINNGSNSMSIYFAINDENIMVNNLTYWTTLTRLKVGNQYNIRLFIKSNTTDYYINDMYYKTVKNYHSLQDAVGLYFINLGYSTVDTRWYIDDIRISPASSADNFTQTGLTDTKAPNNLTGFKVSSTSATQLDLSWNSATDRGTNFSVYTIPFDVTGTKGNVLGYGNLEYGIEGQSLPGWDTNSKLDCVRGYNGQCSARINYTGGVELSSYSGVQRIPDNKIQYRFGGCFFVNCTSAEMFFLSASTTNMFDGTYDNFLLWPANRWQCVEATTAKVVPTDNYIQVRADCNGVGKVWYDNMYAYPVYNTTVTSGTKDYYLAGGGLNAYYTGSSQADSPLPCNSQVCYTIAPRDNSLNVGSTSASLCNYTRVATPGTPLVTASVSTTQLKINVTPVCGVNSPEYDFEETSGNPGATNSGWVGSYSYLDSGLNCFSGYTWRATARNYYDWNTSHSSTSAAKYPIDFIGACSGTGATGYCWTSTTCYYTGSGCPSAATKCNQATPNCCYYNQSHRTEDSCGSSGVTDATYDRDSSQTRCETAVGGASACTAYTWFASGVGPQGNCCGNDGANDDFNVSSGGTDNCCIKGNVVNSGTASTAATSLLCNDGKIYDCNSQASTFGNIDIASITCDQQIKYCNSTNGWSTNLPSSCKPSVSLVSPATGSNQNTPIILKCNITSTKYLVNVSLYLNLSGTWKLNQSKNLVNNKTKLYRANFSISPTTGSYKWNCLAYNNLSTYGWAAANWTFNAQNFGTLNISVYAPANRTQVARYSTLTLNTTIKCLGGGSSTCGKAYAVARYNLSGSEANTKIGRNTIPVSFKDDSWLDWNRTDISGKNAHGIAVDSKDNIIITGFDSDNHFRTVKYNSTGGWFWNQTYSTGTVSYAVGVDSQDNIIITGNDGSGGRTVKYNSSGAYLWNKNFVGGHTYGVAIDSKDNIVTSGTDAHTAYFTVKYNSSGNWLWNRSFKKGFEAFAIAIDSKDNIIITGYDTNFHYRTVKYNSAGGYLWNSTDSSGNYAYGIAVDSKDNVVITGNDLNSRCRTTKYNSTGSLVWNRTCIGPYGLGIAVDSQDNIAVVGSDGHSHDLILKYNATGSLLWNRTYRSAQVAQSVAFDSQDNVILTGYDSTHYRTVKYLVGSNPKSCGTLTIGQTCRAWYTVNATGVVGARVFLDVLSNSSYKSSGIASTNSTDRLVCIGQSCTNNAPSVSVGPTITPGTPNRYKNLTCTFTITDADASDTLFANYTWYNGTTAKFKGRISVTKDVSTNVKLGWRNLTYGNKWNCSITPYDSIVYGTPKSANVTIRNKIPTITAIWPNNNNDTTKYNRTVTFKWTSSDGDSDKLNYSIKVQCRGVCLPYLQNLESNITSENYTLRKELQVDNKYNWSVRVWDGLNWSSWTAIKNFTIASRVIIRLTQNSTNLGTLNKRANVATGGSALPLVVRNDGNIPVNLKVRASRQLWQFANLNTSYFEFKAGNASLKKAYNWTTSRIKWNETSDYNRLVVDHLNYTNLNYSLRRNNASILFNVTVPDNEPPGSKSTGIIVTGWAS